MATSADTTLHLPPTVVPDTCGDLDVDLIVEGSHEIAEIPGN